MMKRHDALQYVGYHLDDALSPKIDAPIPDNAVLVGWQCGFEPMFVAVSSYLPNVTLSKDSAVDIAVDYLMEIEWFGEVEASKNPFNSPIEPDYIIGGTND
jgi:hypothetical protein